MSILAHNRLQDRQMLVTIAAAIIVVCFSIALFFPMLFSWSASAEESSDNVITGLTQIEKDSIREWKDADGNYYVAITWEAEEGTMYVEDEDGNTYLFYPANEPDAVLPGDWAGANPDNIPKDDSWRQETWDQYEDRKEQEANGDDLAKEDAFPTGSIESFYQIIVDNTVGTPTYVMQGSTPVAVYAQPLYESVIGSDGIATTIMNYIKGIAAALLIVYVLLGVIRDAQQGTANPDLFWKVLVRMALTVVLLIYLDDLINALQYFLNTVVGEFSKLLKDYIDTKAPVIDEFTASTDGMSYVRRLIWTAVSFLIFWPFWLIITIIVNVRAMTFLFELGIRKSFLPLAVLNIMEGDDKGLGTRYIKKYFAVYLKIMITILAFGTAVIFSRLEAQGLADKSSFAATSLGGVFSHYAYSTFLTFVAISVSRKGEKIADEVVGT